MQTGTTLRSAAPHFSQSHSVAYNMSPTTSGQQQFGSLSDTDFSCMSGPPSVNYFQRTGNNSTKKPFATKKQNVAHYTLASTSTQQHSGSTSLNQNFNDVSGPPSASILNQTENNSTETPSTSQGHAASTSSLSPPPTIRTSQPGPVEYKRFLLSQNLDERACRRETFRYWPGANVPIDSDQFAQAGFFFTGIADMVECFACHLMLGNWTTSDNPGRRHYQVKPDCRYIANQEGRRSTTPVHADRFLPPANQQEPERYQNAFSPLMQDTQRRLNSFETFEPTRRLQATAREFVDAGFYALGGRDKVACFCCGVRLQNFVEDDMPWIEHARWSPRCEYVRRFKGQEFVTRVLQQFAINRTQHTQDMLHQGGGRDERNGLLDTVESGPSEIPPPFRETPVDAAQRRRNMLAEAMMKSHVLRAIEIFGRVDVERLMQRMIETQDCYHQSSEALCDELLSSRTVLSDSVAVSRSPTSSPDSCSSGDLRTLLNDMQNERRCRQCGVRDSEVALLDCGHVCTCEPCTRDLTLCPICQHPVLDSIRSYRA